MQEDTTIAVTVSAIVVDPVTNVPVVVLEDSSGKTKVPVTIGMGEASAIATELDHIELERPLSHQLLAAMLAKTGASVVRVVVYDWIGDTFYSSVEIKLADGTRTSQDARSSDALALGMHTKADIRVAAHIIDKVDQLEHAAMSCKFDASTDSLHTDSLHTDYLEGLTEEAFGKWKI